MIKLVFITQATQANRKGSLIFGSPKEKNQKKDQQRDFSNIFFEEKLKSLVEFKNFQTKAATEITEYTISNEMNSYCDFIISLFKNQYDILANISDLSKEDLKLIAKNITVIRFYSRSQIKFFQDQIAKIFISSDETISPEIFQQIKEGYDRLIAISKKTHSIEIMCDLLEKAGISGKLTKKVEKYAKECKNSLKNDIKSFEKQYKEKGKENETRAILGLNVLDHKKHENYLHYQCEAKFLPFKELKTKDHKNAMLQEIKKVKDLKHADTLEKQRDVLHQKLHIFKQKVKHLMKYEKSKLKNDKTTGDPTDGLISSIENLKEEMFNSMDKIKQAENDLYTKRFLRSYMKEETDHMIPAITNTEKALKSLQTLIKDSSDIKEKITETNEELNKKLQRDKDLKKKLGDSTIAISEEVNQKLQEFEQHKMSIFDDKTTAAISSNYDDFGLDHLSEQYTKQDEFENIKNNYSKSYREGRFASGNPVKIRDRNKSADKSNFQNPVAYIIVGCGSMIAVHKTFTPTNENLETDQN